MRPRIVAALVTLLVALTVSGCQTQRKATTEPADVRTTNAPEPMQTITIQMNAKNNSGQSGEATLSATDDDKTKVSISLINSPSGPQPVHIHRGTCANLNPTPEYGLTSLAGGKSETVVPVKLDDLLAGTFAINAHKSAEEIQTYVSCGDIKSTAAGGM